MKVIFLFLLLDTIDISIKLIYTVESYTFMLYVKFRKNNSKIDHQLVNSPYAIFKKFKNTREKNYSTPSVITLPPGKLLQ